MHSWLPYLIPAPEVAQTLFLFLFFAKFRHIILSPLNARRRCIFCVNKIALRMCKLDTPLRRLGLRSDAPMQSPITVHLRR